MDLIQEGSGTPWSSDEDLDAVFGPVKVLRVAVDPVLEPEESPEVLVTPRMSEETPASVRWHRRRTD